MSKLAHSNQETMDQIEAQAIADEEAGNPADRIRAILAKFDGGAE